MNNNQLPQGGLQARLFYGNLQLIGCSAGQFPRLSIQTNRFLIPSDSLILAVRPFIPRFSKLENFVAF